MKSNRRWSITLVDFSTAPPHFYFTTMHLLSHEFAITSSENALSVLKTDTFSRNTTRWNGGGQGHVTQHSPVRKAHLIQTCFPSLFFFPLTSVSYEVTRLVCFSFPAQQRFRSRANVLTPHRFINNLFLLSSPGDNFSFPFHISTNWRFPHYTKTTRNFRRMETRFHAEGLSR